MAETSAPSLERPTSIDRKNLRRADWRVLLPVPANGFEHMVLVGGPDGLSDVIVELGVARKVSRAIPPIRSADVVAVLANARADCEQAAASLLPGGTLYWEVESGRSEIKRALQRAGLNPTGFYWVRPDFDRAEVFVPAEIRTAVKWYLRTWSDASSPPRRLLGSRLATTIGARAIYPCLRRWAVTAMAAPVREGGPSILSHPAVPGDLRGVDAGPLVINRGGRDGSRRVMVLPFRTDSVEPLGVLKFSRFPERNAEMEEEQRIAAEVRSRLAPTMRRSIPTPLGTFRWGQVLVGIETYAGRPISNHPANRPRRRIEDLLLVEKWLEEFHRQSHISRDPFSVSQLKTYVEHPLDDYVAALGSDPKEKLLFGRVRERAHALLGSLFPVVWSHGGFSEFNICRSGADISVIDWEGVGVGPALMDLIYFVTVWYHRCQRTAGIAAQLDSFQKLFFPSGHDRLALLASEALDDYMRSLSMDRRFFPVMLVLTWVTRALGHYRRNRAFAEQRPDPREGNHVGFLRILAERCDKLFLENKS